MKVVQGQKPAKRTFTDDMKRKVIGIVTEDYTGPVRRHNVFSRGCPKCNADAKNIVRKWCPGEREEYVEPDMNTCHVPGQHLHGECTQCQFVWREECRDVDDVPNSTHAEATGD